MTDLTAPLLQAACSTAYKTAGAVWSTGSRRIAVYEAELDATGGLSSTDCQVQWDLSRFSQTAILTAVAVVLNEYDSADGTSLAVFQNNATSELTYTTAGAGLSMKNWTLNQRGAYRWRALDDNDNIVIPAINLAGIGIRGLSPNFTGSLCGSVSFLER